MNPRAKQYLEASRLYFKNAHALKTESRAKAGELMWGAFAELVKAIAIQRFDKPLSQEHTSISRAYEEMALELADRGIFEGGRAAEKLHANFYEQFLREDEWAENVEKVTITLGRLESILLLQKH